MIADQAPPKMSLPERMKRQPALLAISGMILAAALVGIGVLIGQVIGPKSPWLLWSQVYVSAGGSSVTKWGLVSAHESKRECERSAEELKKLNPGTSSASYSSSSLYSCFPLGVDPRDR